MSYLLSPIVSVCVEECPAENDFNKFHCLYEVQASIDEMIQTAGSNATKHSLYLFYSAKKECLPQVGTREYIGYCTPKVIGDIISDELSIKYESNVTSISSGGDFSDTMADLYLTKYIILAFGIGCSLVLGFIFLMLMRIPILLPVMLWSLILGISAGLGFGGYLLHETSLRWDKQGTREEHEIKILYWLSIVSYSCSGIWFVIVCAIRKRIILATSCIKEASAAIFRIPIIVVYPVLQVAGFVLYFLLWSYSLVYLASTGDLDTKCMCSNLQSPDQLINDSDDNMICGDGCYPYKSFTYTKESTYAGWFMVFSFFWTSSFIMAIGEVTVAMAISMWYFSRDKKTVSSSTLFKAIGLTTFYHLGTCAFGSLIMAVVKTLRAIVLYIQKKAAKLNNKAAKVILMTLQCCLCVVEKCIKFISKNAYIQVAMHGNPFCVSARDAFTLIMENAMRISAVSVVSSLVLFIVKAFIVTASTVLGYVYLEYYYDNEIHGLYFVTVLMFLTSLATAEMFNQVFSMTISTILQCFVYDETMFEVRNQ